MPPVRIIGAGLAGSEAAWQCARQGIAVELFEMRPVRSTPAHQTADFAELVCSNSLKSDSENTAPWLLKEEMRRAGSLLARNRPPVRRSGRTRARRRSRHLRRQGHRSHLARAADHHPPRRSHAHRRRPTHHHRHRPADLRRALAGNRAPQRSSRICISTTPSAPSSKPTPSTWPRSTWRRATTKAPPTTSTAP